jgi:hypothetical protein
MCSFDRADLGTNSDVLLSFPVRCRNVCGTFEERLWNVCSFTVLTLLPGADSRTLSASVCTDNMTGGVCGRLGTEPKEWMADF